MSIYSARHFHDEEAAYAFVEARVWPDGRVCPHCGSVDRSGQLKGKSTRIGLYKCYDCRKPFTVKIGTIFEASHVPLHNWLQAIFLLCASKKGISANQLHRTLGVTLKTAWFMGHRIREAMRNGDLSPMGSNGGVVEVDETYIGHKKGQKKRRGAAHKHAVLSLVERGAKVRSVHIDNTKSETILPIIRANVAKEARVMTDEAGQYRRLGDEFAEHGAVAHAKGEYVRGDVHTNTLENYYSIFKRGMKGIYQHCGERHLHRYVAEFDFRYNQRSALGVEDTERADSVISGIVGKRLTYRRANAGWG